MKEFAKRQIQKIMIHKRHALYEARVASQTVPYDVWIENQLKKQEEAVAAKPSLMENAPILAVWSYDQVDGRESFLSLLSSCATDYVLFTSDPSGLVSHGENLAISYLSDNPGLQIGYADETDYLKPGWSPDLLRSLFYFGNVFIIQRKLLEKVKTGISKNDYCGKVFLYDLVLCCIQETKEAQKIPLILYDNRKSGGYQEWGFEPEYDVVKDCRFLPEKLNQIETEWEDERNGSGKVKKMVSVIIPSKDNPSVLSLCIHSLLEVTDFGDEKYKIQIIVVDNGSSLENKEKIERMQNQLKEEYSFRYEYHPMPFNFSKMCNLGASVADGDYLLFLNDDIQVVQEDWLSKMLQKAARGDVGAVGAKLLYPDGERIQHVGITSIHLGPAHKLQFASDKENHYHRYHRSSVNVLAVTGACLMMRKELFEQIGGFDENLQVAFNDVELCFAAHKLGYHNVCCNDTYLYHHESLSRGYDAGMEKIRRLHEERDYLYGKYPEYWNHDPYYNPLLVSDILDKGFEGKNRYCSDSEAAYATPVLQREAFPDHWYNECLYMGVEYAGDEKQWQTGVPGEGSYYIQGWSYAVNVDNSRYEKKIVLKNLESAEAYVVPTVERYRPDMEEMLPYIDHPALCGVEVRIQEGSLQSGTYLIGYLWEDTASRQKLLGFTGETLGVR